MNIHESARSAFLNGPRRTQQEEQAAGKNPTQQEQVQVIEIKNAEDMNAAMAQVMAQVFGVALEGMGDDPKQAAIKSTLRDLESNGYKAVKAEARDIQRSHDAGFESLVRFKEPKGVTVSFRNPAELDKFAELVKGQGDAETVKLRDQLKQFQLAGDSFYFPRGEGSFMKPGPDWLRTDANGAALMLGRGEPVHRVTGDGQVLPLKSKSAVASSTPEPADPQKAAIGKNVDAVQALGIDVAPMQELPENLSVTDMAEMARHNLSELKKIRRDPEAQLRMRAEIVETLNNGGFVTVGFPNGSNGLGDQGVTLNAGQLEKLIPFEASPTPEQIAFKTSFENLEKSGHVMLGRGMAGINAGMLSKADARIGYLTLAEGGEMVVLDPKGGLHSLKKLDQLTTLEQNGKIPHTNTPVDPAKPKTNLFMLYFVSPFDPLEKGIYEDLPLRMSDVGSGDHMDMVTLRSDLPHKKNLTMDYIQKGELQEIERLDATNTHMNDPKTLEDFVYKSIKAHPDDQKIRLMVAGHGGAEKGLCPDGPDNNAAAHNAMPVDDFAGAIKKALDRVEAETGKRPVIDNLIIGSCLMGNTSFINALAQTGDIKALSASPEVLMGNDPEAIFSYLNDPKTANADAHTYARDLVDIVQGHAAFPGGKKNMQFADTFGAYDLDKTKAQKFESELNNFWKVCLAHPDSAKHIKEDIWACPTYGVNQVMNTMMDVDDRDIIQVAERIQGDARIPQAIKDQCAKLIEAANDQVLVQKVNNRYEGRQGATLYLPVDRFDFDDKMGETALLKSGDYKQFMDMIFDAPLHRNVVDNLFTGINRVTEQMRNDKKAQTPEEKAQAEAMAEMKKQMGKGQKEMQERMALKALEEPPEMGAVARTARFIGQGIRTVCTVAGALAGAGVGIVIGAPLGLLLGAKAGFSGHSIASKGYEAPLEDKKKGPADPMKELQKAMDPMAAIKDAVPGIARLVVQGALTPTEYVGEKVNKKLSYSHGTAVGKLAGTFAGAGGGVLGGAASGAAVGGLVGGGIARALASVVTFWTPKPPSKPEEPSMMGIPLSAMFGPPPDEDKA